MSFRLWRPGLGRAMVPRGVLMMLLAGLGTGAGITGCAGQTGGAVPTQATHVTPAPRRAIHRRRRRRGRHRLAAPGHPRLAPSRASNETVQAQPGAGACHAIGAGVYSRPDPRCTPGALNPDVRQSNINQTICVPGWTATVRPPESITEAEKRLSLAAYGDAGPLGDYEYDHLVPLELGGATNAARNLWPEPGASPNPKDAVELALHDRVCRGQMALARAQREIAANWVKAVHTTPGIGVGPVSRPASCTVHAAYSPHYHDYDVYVSSNQPEHPVTVTGAGRRRSWHTDARGEADVYFPGTPASRGQAIAVRVGGARCVGTL